MRTETESAKHTSTLSERNRETFLELFGGKIVTVNFSVVDEGGVKAEKLRGTIEDVVSYGASNHLLMVRTRVHLNGIPFGRVIRLEFEYPATPRS